MKIKVSSNSKSKSYSVQIKSGLLSETGQIIKKTAKGQIVILTSKNVHKLWYNKLNKSFKSSGLKAKLILIPDGERHKSLRTYNHVISEMLDIGIDRYSTLITLGGGVIGDLGGLVAATFMRGIDLIHIPTSLIAQIDSSIGGKVAIDHPNAKNIIGAFYNPTQVLTDPNILNTLSKKEFINGLFEALKIAIIRDKQLYDYISKNIDLILERNEKTIEHLVKSSVKLKADIIQKDPFEKKLRMVLNFGHTFGHALETSGGYKNISHGVAVGCGMLLAFQLSHFYKFIDIRKHQKTIDLINILIDKNKIGKLNSENLWKTMTLDKKAKNNKVRFVLLKGIARPIIQEIDKNSFKKVFGNL